MLLLTIATLDCDIPVCDKIAETRITWIFVKTYSRAQSFCMVSLMIKLVASTLHLNFQYLKDTFSKFAFTLSGSCDMALAVVLDQKLDIDDDANLKQHLL